MLGSVLHGVIADAPALAVHVAAAAHPVEPVELFDGRVDVCRVAVAYEGHAEGERELADLEDRIAEAREGEPSGCEAVEPAAQPPGIAAGI